MGCANERDPINQVQIGALPKTFFVGEKLEDASDDPEFYFRTTVVDVAAGAGSEELFTSSDAQPTVRIRWEITETKLIARLAYELVDGTDGKGNSAAGARNDEPRPPVVDGVQTKVPARTTTDGQIVASFDITKQFDVRRGYNSQTGEENNIVEENDEDRPWNQREYLRVDWSKNLVTDAYDLDAVSQMGLYGGIKWDPIEYHVSDPENPDAPAIDLDKGYLDVTNKAFAAPQVIHDEEFGYDFPVCQLIGEYPRISCNPSEVKLRLAFKKVVDTDYEAADWDGRKMELFGFFTSDRYGYDRRYGVIDEKWHRYAARWNVYEKSHDPRQLACATPELTPPGADVHRDLNANGTEDECEDVGRGSRCDEARHLCTIPLRDRKIKTIPWYVNRDFPAEIFDGGRKVVDTWSDGIRVALIAGRLAECRRTGEPGCEAAMGWPAQWADDFSPPVGSSSTAEVPHVFVLCHNPVDPTKDDPACGEAGLSPRMGDLRYNFFTYVVAAQAQGPWGIMVDAEDPLTGEKIAGSVNQWGATLDRAAAQLVDLVELINGTTSPDAFISGQDVSEWVRANSGGGPAEKPAPMSAAEHAQRMGAFDPHAMSPFATGAPKAARQGPKVAQYRARMKELETAGKLGPGNAALTKRIGKLHGSDLEAKLVTPEVAQLAGFNPNEPVTKAGLDRASPFARTNPMMRRSLARRGLLGRAKRHACRTEAPDGDHLANLARTAQALYGKVDPKDPTAVKDHRDKIYQWARKEYAVGVFSHEFGHSMGLRHNFAGTFDSLNYDTRYWQLRTKNGTVTKACAPGTTDGAGCIGPRYLDPITDDEINGGIGGYATSSVMDYPGDQALDMYLIGKYDRAALRFGYGGVVDVWATPGMSVTGSGDGKAKAYQAIGLTDPPGLFGVRSFPDAGANTSSYMHYSQYAARFNLTDGCHADPESPLGTTCTGAGLDVVDYRDMKDFAAVPEYAAFATSASAVDPTGRVRRGYMFSSDEFADTGNVPSFRYDAGADPYEQVRFLETAYENRYILDAFRRGRTMFNSADVVSRVQGHYLDTIQLLAKTFGFAMVLEVDDPSKPTPELLSDGNYGPLAMATSVSFDLFTRMLTRPEPGAYCSTGSDQCPGVQPYGLLDYIYVADSVPLPASTPYDFQVALGTGRYIHNDFDYGQGYWWSDYQKQVGSFYDKTWAVYYLSESFDSFISNSKEDFVDGRYKNINFATVYPEQIRRLFAALLTGDIESIAPWAEAVPGPQGIPGAKLSYPDWHLVDGLGTRPAKPKLVDPAFGFNEQLYAMVWGTMLFPTGFSRTFIDDARITALPTEQPSWPATETYTFIDPATSIAYHARTTGTEKLFGVDREKSIGARMLEWANNLVFDAYICETDAQGFYLLNPDGTPKLKLKNGKPQVNPDVVGGDTNLKKYVSNIEVMRQLVQTFVVPLESALPAP
ncbi:MAG: hypothetical protein JWP87_1803 [Labilithrix sp.]|nr:hypothetical protein [Labilithrix sp.]